MRASRTTIFVLLPMVTALMGAGTARAASDAPLASGWVTNGTVDAVTLDDAGRTYLGGDFTRIGPRTGHGVKLTATSDVPASGFADVDFTDDAAAADGAG